MNRRPVFAVAALSADGAETPGTENELPRFVR